MVDLHNQFKIKHCSLGTAAHLMVSGSVEDPAKKTDVTNKLRVDPELEEETKLRMDKKL